MIIWRWEQGRSDYFRFESVCLAAKVLIRHGGMQLNDRDADVALRTDMEESAGLRFLPVRYTVWRNYGRYFKAALLASSIRSSNGERLALTEICRELAEDRLTPDDYFFHLFRVFYFDGPVFDARHYSPQAPQIFPFCALARFLIAKRQAGQSPCLLPEEAGEFLIANEIVGDESDEHLGNLAKRDLRLNKDRIRQIREMMAFAGQASFFKWDGKNLCLDIPDSAENALMELSRCLMPLKRHKESDANQEILNLGARPQAMTVWRPPIIDTLSLDTFDTLIGDARFREGAPRRINHIVVERSPKLRELFFQHNKKATCDITGNPPDIGFPWATNLLEIHHVMPLSSVIKVNRKGTSLADLVALTPSSHRAIHLFYRQWLDKNNRADFSGKAEAWEVYRQAKDKYRRVHR